MGDIYQTCQQYGKGSRLCHKTAVSDTAGLAAGEIAGRVAGNTIAEWSGCNALLDFETAGTGILVCTVTVGLASIAASSIIGDSAQYASGKIYDSVNNNVTTAIVYQHSYNINH